MICTSKFGINSTSDISKLLYVISQAVTRVKFETILKHHKQYLCRISRTDHAIICLYYYPQKVCNFYMQVFQIKLKYHCSKPIKSQKLLMSQYKRTNGGITVREINHASAIRKLILSYYVRIKLPLFYTWMICYETCILCTYLPVFYLHIY